MNTRKLNAILIVALTLRIGLLVAATASPDGQLFTPDSARYAELASSITEDGRFAYQSRPEVFRTPGYPVLLASVVWTGAVWPALAAQLGILLDVAATAGLALLGWLLWDQRVGLTAALLHAVNPVAIAASVRILTDGPFAAILLAGLLLVIAAMRTGSLPAAAGAAALLAAACFVRPIGLLVSAVVLVVLAVRALARPRGQMRWLQLALTGLLVLGPVSLWIARNRATAGYAGFSSVGEVNLVKYEAAATLARVESIDLEAARYRLESRIRGRLAEQNRTDLQAQAAVYRDVAWEVIRADPGAWAWVHLRGSLGALLPGITDVMEVAGLSTGQRGTLAVLQQDGLWAAARHYFGGRWWLVALAGPFVLMLLGRYVLATVAVVRGAGRGVRAECWLLLSVAGVLLLAGGPASTPRFRVPVAGLISLAAAVGLFPPDRRRADSSDDAPTSAADGSPVNRSQGRSRPGCPCDP
jgi:4-amino-4-deoxy-L-arabinose transferase-like glycosyltransferase